MVSLDDLLNNGNPYARFYIELFLFSIGVFVLVWMYTIISKRDIISEKRREVESRSLLTKIILFLDHLSNFVKYFLIFPIVVALWVLVVSLFSHTFFGLSVDRAFYLASLLAASSRILSYFSEKSAEEVAKMIPITLIFFYVTTPDTIVSLLNESFSLDFNLILENIRFYLPLVFSVEIMLRLLYTVSNAIFKGGGSG